MQQRMHVIGHYHKTDTGSLDPLQFLGQKMNDYTLGSVIIEQLSPPVAGKGHKVGMSFSIEDPSL